jgi:DeoR family transcriptional regulator, ulaG and ulaABCDEF operon transcriptional repressor
MTDHARRKKLLKLVEARHAIRVVELEAALGVSAATIRRDIHALAASKLLTKVHGGAEKLVQDKPPALASTSFQESSLLRRPQKRGIARRAAELCNDGETIIINGGSTTFLMADYLADRRMTILTNSFLMAQQLLATSNNDIVLPGGKVYREQNVIVSPFDNDAVQNHYATKMFIGASAVSPLGLLESDPLLVRAELKLIKQADELIVLVDSTKFQSRRAGLIVCPLARVRTLITDDGVAPATLQMLKGQGIEVMVVAARGEER